MANTVMQTFSRMLAAAAIFGLAAAPVASADQDRRHQDRYDRQDRARDHYNDRRHARREHRRRDRHHRRGRSHYYDDGYRLPPRARYHRRYHHRYDHPRHARHYRHYPRYAHRHRGWYAHGPRIRYVRKGYYHGPHYRRGYVPRYHIGARYVVHPHTVYITDYHGYGLYAPPPGHYWVRDHHSGDAILASVATGAIIGLVIGALAYD